MFRLGLLLLALLLFAQVAMSQRYFTRNGKISFTSEAPLEKIFAVNNGVSCVLDAESGNLEVGALIKAFQFEKALMQQHFNENYMESGKFPKAVFKGQIANLAFLDLQKSGAQELEIEGEMTIHGVTKTISFTGVINNDGENLEAKSTFILKPGDFKIKIPAIVRDNIAKEILVEVEFALEVFGKS